MAKAISTGRYAWARSPLHPGHQKAGTRPGSARPPRASGGYRGRTGVVAGEDVGLGGGERPVAAAQKRPICVQPQMQLSCTASRVLAIGVDVRLRLVVTGQY